MQRKMYVVGREQKPQNPGEAYVVHVARTPARKAFGLPAQITTFIGREAQTASIIELVRRDVRLLTLYGAPGTGKTRLALHVASQLGADFEDGVAFVDLASARDPASVARTIAAVLGLNPPNGQDLFAYLRATLANRNMLLLLDNFEQIATAAPLLVELLADCPAIKLLVTSRSILHVRGEHKFNVPPLTLPDLTTPLDRAQVLQSEAVALFEQRAQAISPDFQLTEANMAAVAQVCAQLDGLPLAVELAAARVSLMPVESMPRWMGSRLQFLGRGPRDLPERQQTLYSTIDWSYNLLEEADQDLFRRLSVFRGGFTLEAAEAMRECAGVRPQDSPSSRRRPGATILDEVASLLDKGLLQQMGLVAEEPRLRMLTTIQEYAWLRLVESGQLDTIREHHARFFCRLAEAAEAGLLTACQTSWLDRLDAEQHNLLAALDWCQESEDSVPLALRLSGALWFYWEMRSYWGEGRRLAALLASPAAGGRTPTRAKALWILARLHATQGDDGAAEGPFEESLQIFRGMGDDLGTSRALMGLGQVAMRRCDFERARLLLDESLTLRRKLGDGQLIAHGLAQLAAVAVHQGDHDAAGAFLDEALSLAQATGDGWTMGNLWMAAGWTSLNLGRYHDAEASIGRALELFLALNSKSDIAACLQSLANCAHLRGDLLRSARLVGATEEVMSHNGLKLGGKDPSSHSSFIEDLRTRLGGIAFVRLLEEGRAISPADITADFNTGNGQALAESPGFGVITAGMPGEPSSDAPGQPTGKYARGRDQYTPVSSAETDELSVPATLEEAGLTLREIEVLQLLSVGLTNKQIGERLTISRHTVNVHVKTIFSKLAVTSRAAATYFAVTNKLV